MKPFTEPSAFRCTHPGRIFVSLFVSLRLLALAPSCLLPFPSTAFPSRVFPSLPHHHHHHRRRHYHPHHGRLTATDKAPETTALAGYVTKMVSLMQKD